jgi:hypothetical protein
MLMLWPIVWLVFMLGLIVVTIVAALKEKKARAVAAPYAQSNEVIQDSAQVESGGDLFGNAPEFNAADDPFK